MASLRFISRPLATVAIALLVASCSQTTEASPVRPTSQSIAATPTTALAAESTPADTTAQVQTGQAMASLIDGSTLAAAPDGSGGFIGVGDNPEGKFTVVRSGDGLEWFPAGFEPTGLPESLAGPYRLWPFGSGFMLYGSSGFENEELLGEDPFVAITSDLRSWTELDLPGIDPLFYQGWQRHHGPGNVSGDGQVAVFLGWNRAFESGVGGRVAWMVRPGKAPEFVGPDKGALFATTMVQGEVVGAVGIRGSGHQLFILDENRWQPLPAQPSNPRLLPEVRSVGSSLVLLNSGESWLSDDLGQSWTQVSTIPAEIRSFGYFGDFAAAGPAEPPFGTPESFQFSTNGTDWVSVALPEGASDIRHLTSSPLGLLSLVKFNGPQRFETIFTPAS